MATAENEKKQEKAITGVSYWIIAAFKFLYTNVQIPSSHVYILCACL